MSNIDFTHKTIENQTAGISVSKTTFQSVFDAIRKIVNKSYRGSTEKLDADLLAGVVPGAGGLAALAKSATIWASDNDGNGGQPPAPKPTNATPAGGANAPGKFIPINETSAYIIPGTASTYWLGIIICHVTSTGAVVAANSGGGIWAGGTVFTCGAGQTIQGFIWRQV